MTSVFANAQSPVNMSGAVTFGQIQTFTADQKQA